MKLINLTAEQNEQLKEMHMDSMDMCEKMKAYAKALNDDEETKQMGLMYFVIAKVCLELGDFEKHPEFPEFPEF